MVCVSVLLLVFMSDVWICCVMFLKVGFGIVSVMLGCVRLLSDVMCFGLLVCIMIVSWFVMYGMVGFVSVLFVIRLLILLSFVKYVLGLIVYVMLLMVIVLFVWICLMSRLGGIVF